MTECKPLVFERRVETEGGTKRINKNKNHKQQKAKKHLPGLFPLHSDRVQTIPFRTQGSAPTKVCKIAYWS
jgi:hypothetical protein